ncbi:glycosyltransferase family 87 protein [uncultured Bacteroides sp.]|uniref:glycosyltransferase family 87 protein n=1 Tax=uncultured Bacteroides sp. TaxID=162156 RepID=UPI002AA6BBB6|nr:glycosyltransferase family 87 protein [uncultured Bacteroides sp.]
MRIFSKLNAFINKNFFKDYRTLFGLWILLSLISGLFKNKGNNYLIFKYVFWHTIEKTSLYATYPQYFDTNHYGPFFSLIIAPFSILPNKIGMTLWVMLLSVSLYYAIRKLPLSQKQHIFIYWFCANELLTALFMQQFNIAIAAIIIATFYCIKKEKDIWATFFIMLGTFVKLYGIVGFAFFFFSKHKKTLILSAIGWALIMYVAPMLISSPEYIASQYKEWWISLTQKNGINMLAEYQNISVLGMIRKISGCISYSDIWILLAGVLIFSFPYLRLKQYKHEAFRYAILASTLMFSVLFSTGSESSSYIIALTGVCIWYTTSPWERSKTDVALMIFAFVLTSLSPTDLFPAALKSLIRQNSLKALPCFIIWLKLSYEMCCKNYDENIYQK